jgi:hypothetical protein
MDRLGDGFEGMNDKDISLLAQPMRTMSMIKVQPLLTESPYLLVKINTDW